MFSDPTDLQTYTLFCQIVIQKIKNSEHDLILLHFLLILHFKNNNIIIIIIIISASELSFLAGSQFAKQPFKKSFSNNISLHKNPHVKI